MTAEREPRGRRPRIRRDDTGVFASPVFGRTVVSPIQVPPDATVDGSAPQHYQPALWLENEWLGEIPVPYGVIPF